MKLKTPPLEKIISEKKNEFTDQKNVDKDPLFEEKFKYYKEFLKSCLENDRKLHLYDILPEDSENFEPVVTEEVLKIKRLQKFFRCRLFQRRIEMCLSKRLHRGDISQFEKFYNIKDIVLFEDSQMRSKNDKGGSEAEKRQFLRQKNKTMRDPYKKDIIMIRKLPQHKFNNIEPAKVKVYYHIFFNTIIVDIKYKNMNKTQQLTNPLSFFGVADFNKAYFIKNFNELILDCLHYSQTEKTVYYVKRESKSEKPKKTILKPGGSPSKNVDRLNMTPEERRRFDIMLKEQEGSTRKLLLDRIRHKIEDEYLSVQLSVNLEHNFIHFQARKYDDPYQKIERQIFLPQTACDFLKSNNENESKIKRIFTHFVKNVKDRVDWQEKSLTHEKVVKEFQKIVMIEEAVLRIQKAFRRSIQKKQHGYLKESFNRSKVLVLRKFYKICGSYADVLFFMWLKEPVLEIKATNMSHLKRNVKVFKLDISRYLSKVNVELKSKENMVTLILQIIKLLSIKIVHESLFILTNNEDISIEELDSYMETDREYGNRIRRRRSSLLALFMDKNGNFIRKQTKKETLQNGSKEILQNIRDVAAALIQNRIRIMRMKKVREYNRMVLNAKTIYLLTIIDKVQGNYVLAYFYYLKPFDEILINLANLNQTRKILKSYTIDIPSISKELFAILQKSKETIEKQRPLYYQRIFCNLLKLLWKRIEISFVYDKLNARSVDKNLKLKDVSELKKKKKDMEDMEAQTTRETRLKYAIRIQRSYRHNRTKLLFHIIKESEKKRLEEVKKYGIKIKHKIKLFNEIPFFIFVYVKNEQTLYFVAIKKDRRSHLRICRAYHLDNLKLINTNGMDVVDFLLANLKIYDEQIFFDIENLQVLTPDSGNAEGEEANITSPSVKKGILNLFKFSGVDVPVPEVKENVKVDRIEEYFKPVIETPELNPKIIHQRREEISENKMCIFNVYYQKNVRFFFYIMYF